VFNRSYEYIQKVDINDLVTQEALFKFADIHLKVALELSINYFQEHEEYEKCAHLKKSFRVCKTSLNLSLEFLISNIIFQSREKGEIKR
jgi:hypothetical protein